MACTSTLTLFKDRLEAEHLASINQADDDGWTYNVVWNGFYHVIEIRDEDDEFVGTL